MVHRIRTIDAHAAGEPLRLIIDGLPSPEGKTMLEKRAWARKRLDHLRRSLMLEPRGHTDMYGAILTEAVTPGANAGLLFMHNEGWSTMCGHGIIAVTTIALERELMWAQAPREGVPYVDLKFDTPAGLVEARANVTKKGDLPQVSSVAFRNVPSFVFEPSVPIMLAGRKVPVDIAFGGAFYAIVDAEAAGLPIDVEHLPELRRVGMLIAREVNGCGAWCTRTTLASKASTARSSRRHRSCRRRICVMSRSSRMPRSIDLRAERAPRR